MTSVPTHVLSEYARNQLRDTFADVRQCVLFYFMPYIYCKGALTAESRNAAMLDTCSGRPPPLAGRPPLWQTRLTFRHARLHGRWRGEPPPLYIHLTRPVKIGTKFDIFENQ